MKKTILMAFIALGLFASSCCKDPIFDDGQGRGDRGCGNKEPTTSCTPLNQETNPKLVDCIPNDDIKRAWIEGNNLKIEVAYSGCNQHDFQLNWNGGYMKSNPPQVNLELQDKTGEQMCNAYFQHTLCYDISKLRIGAHGEVIVHLAGYMGNELRYKY